MRTRLITPPSVEPIDAAFLREHAKLDADEPDALLNLYIRAARETCEHATGRALLTQEWEAIDWPAGDRLPHEPVQSVVSASWRDSLGAYTLIDPSRYTLAGSWLSWADATLHDVLTVRYVAGWESPEDVPASLRHWVAIRAVDGVANRESIAPMGGLSPLPYIDSLLDPWRTYR